MTECRSPIRLFDENYQRADSVYSGFAIETSVVVM